MQGILALPLIYCQTHFPGTSPPSLLYVALPNEELGLWPGLAQYHTPEATTCTGPDQASCTPFSRPIKLGTGVHGISLPTAATYLLPVPPSPLPAPS